MSKKKLIISPQAGFGNRLRALCSAKLLGLLTGREVYHFWIKDSALSIVDHVNYMKETDPTHFFDIKIPLFEGTHVDVCFTEWMPDDGWYKEQSTAQSHLIFDHRIKSKRAEPFQDASEIASSSADIILVETSLELRLPHMESFQEMLMSQIYQENFQPAGRWKEMLESLPVIENGVSIRRGNLMKYYPEADISVEKMCEKISLLNGPKIIFSDDSEYLEKIRTKSNCPLNIDGLTKILSPVEFSFVQFLFLAKCKNVFGTKNSSFPKQAAIFGGRPYYSL